MNNCYMQNTESAQENETNKVPWDFEIQTNGLISARRQDLIIMIIKKRTSIIVDIAILADDRIKLKESENSLITWTMRGNWNKTVEHESDVYASCIRCCW